MFTGIVTEIGEVRAIADRADGRIEITTAMDTAEIAIGASISCSGACLSVIDKGPGWFAVAASAETRAKTTLAEWTQGTRVNLERPLRSGDELGGHIVLGHVDGTAKVIAATPADESLRLDLDSPAELARFIAPKGSVAIDGVSMTVNEVDGCRFGVNVIAHTRAATVLGARAVGDSVNLEIDVLARYLARLLEERM
ncbi:MAG: riboflavin synthase [Rhodospirillales bacterium]|jgi:riboflavin synthase|nr:riboflavin synthase [Rhodospirillales bacterium]